MNDNIPNWFEDQNSPPTKTTFATSKLKSQFSWLTMGPVVLLVIYSIFATIQWFNYAKQFEAYSSYVDSEGYQPPVESYRISATGVAEAIRPGNLYLQDLILFVCDFVTNTDKCDVALNIIEDTKMSQSAREMFYVFDTSTSEEDVDIDRVRPTQVLDTLGLKNNEPALVYLSGGSIENKLVDLNKDDINKFFTKY